VEAPGQLPSLPPPTFTLNPALLANSNKLSPRGRRDDMAGYASRRWQFDGGKNRGGSTSVRGRFRSPHISGGRQWLSCRQPACLQPKQLCHGTDRRSIGSRYPKMPL